MGVFRPANGEERVDSLQVDPKSLFVCPLSNLDSFLDRSEYKMTDLALR